MKKFMALGLALVMVFSLIGCGGSTSSDVAEDTSAEAATEAVSKSGDGLTNGEVFQVPVTVYNYCDSEEEPVDLYGLQMTASGIEEWGDDVLGGDVLAYGEGKPIVLNYDINTLVWDMKATDVNGDAVEFYGLDITDASAEGFDIYLTYDTEEESYMAYAVNPDE